MKALPFVATLLFALCGCSVRYGVVGESYKSAAEISSRADDLSNVVVATVPRTKKPLEATALVVLPSRDRIVKDSYSQLAPIMQDAYSRCDERFFQSVYQMMEKRGIFATVTAAESASPETAPFDGRDFVIYYCATPAQGAAQASNAVTQPPLPGYFAGWVASGQWYVKRRDWPAARALQAWAGPTYDTAPAVAWLDGLEEVARGGAAASSHEADRSESNAAALHTVRVAVLPGDNSRIAAQGIGAKVKPELLSAVVSQELAAQKVFSAQDAVTGYSGRPTREELLALSARGYEAALVNEVCVRNQMKVPNAQRQYGAREATMTTTWVLLYGAVGLMMLPAVLDEMGPRCQVDIVRYTIVDTRNGQPLWTGEGIGFSGKDNGWGPEADKQALSASADMAIGDMKKATLNKRE